jgi:hypothetical protein
MYRVYVHPERHKDIYEYLERLDNSMRGEIIRAAVRLYIHFQGNKLFATAAQVSSNTVGPKTEPPEITHDLTQALPF